MTNRPHVWTVGLLAFAGCAAPPSARALTVVAAEAAIGPRTARYVDLAWDTLPAKSPWVLLPEGAVRREDVRAVWARPDGCELILRDGPSRLSRSPVGAVVVQLQEFP